MLPGLLLVAAAMMLPGLLLVAAARLVMVEHHRPRGGREGDGASRIRARLRHQVLSAGVLVAACAALEPAHLLENAGHFLGPIVVPEVVREAVRLEALAALAQTGALQRLRHGLDD